MHRTKERGDEAVFPFARSLVPQYDDGQEPTGVPAD